MHRSILSLPCDRTTPTFLEEVYAPTDGSAEVDIVFVHGLNPINTQDFAKRTWTYKTSDRETLWPRDLLPNNVPNCRILIFGYNSNVTWDVSLQGIKEHANTLLDRFSGIREDAETRPIIFIAHSLGGLVVKQALINATNNSHTYGPIKAATYGLVFFGTPHQGGNGTEIGKVVTNIITAVSGSVRNDLLNSLSKDSILTMNTNEDFSHQWEDYRVISFYETRETVVKNRFFSRILNSIVVDSASAKLGLGGRRETQLPIDADHSGICKFEAANHKYEPIGRNIRNLVKYSIKEAKNRLQGPEDRLIENASPHILSAPLSEKEQKCIQGFFLSDYETHRQEISRRHYSGTCEWVLKRPEYRSWSENKRECLLWISGNPGMGKSVLASFLLNHLEDSVKKAADSTKRVIYFFFNDQDENKKTVVSFLRAVIHQLLAASPFLLRKYVTPHYESLGDQLYGSFATLWKIFIAITNDAELDGSYCVIDALDECEDKSRVQLLQQLTELSNASPAASGTSQHNSLRFILTSRPYDYIRVELSGSSVIHLGAEHEDESVNADIRQFIASEVENLARNRGYNHSLRETVEHELNKGADGMFLWVVLIIEILKKTPTSDIERKMKELPKKIDDVYTQILRDMPTFGWKILMWVLYAHHPLKLDELAVAYTIQKEHKTLSSIPTDALDGIRGDIKLCGPILKVQKDNSVHLVHQSAKDFLLRSDLANPSTREFLASNSQSHYEIAISCITYLSLDNFPNVSQVDNNTHRYLYYKYLEIQSSHKSHSFLEYAALYWHRHVVQAEEKYIELWGCVYGLLHVESKRDFSMNAYYSFGQKNRYSAFIHHPSPLHILCRFGFHFFLQNLSLQEKVDVNSRDSNDQTPLHWAALGGYVEVAKVLLGTQGVDVNSKDREGWTPLSWAAFGGHVEVVKLLLGAQGVDLNSKNQDEWTPLSWAASKGHLEVVKLLLGTQGVDVNSKGQGGRTPLSWAAFGGHVEVVKLLLGTHSVDVDSKDQGGWTPLHWAASKEYVEVVKLLLRTQGVDVDSKDEGGRTPLFWAASKGHLEVVKLLLGTHSVDVNSKDQGGRTPLFWAASKGHVEVVKLLVGIDEVDLNSKDSRGQTPLLLAIDRHIIELLRSLGGINGEEGASSEDDSEDEEMGSGDGKTGSEDGKTSSEDEEMDYEHEEID